MKFKNILYPFLGLITTLLFSCAIQSNTVNTENKSLVKNDLETQKIISRIKNKKVYEGDVNVKINTSLINNSVDGKIFSLVTDENNSGFNIQSLPQENIVFQETFTIEKNERVILRNFSIPDTTKRYTLNALRLNKCEAISTININGMNWINSNDFNKNNRLEVTKDSLLLLNNNSMQIKLKGNIGDKITITIAQGGKSGVIKRRIGLLKNPQTQFENIKGNDINIFYPDDPDSLGNLKPADLSGDILITGSRPISKLQLNGENNLKFEAGFVIFKADNDNNLTQFKRLYDAEIIDTLGGFHLMKINLNKSPIYDLERLIREYNKGIEKNIESLEFSSLDALKTFTAILDIAINHPEITSSLNLNTLGLVSSNNFIDIDDRYFYTYNNEKTLRTWWLSLTNVPQAWDLTEGENVTSAHIDGGGYIISHPEISNRLLENANNFLNDKIQRDSYDKKMEGCFGCYEFISPSSSNIGIIDDTEFHHGHYSIMVGYASKDNQIRTSGVAPKTKLIPYSVDSDWNMAKAIKYARLNGAKVISISLLYPKLSGFDSFYWVSNLFSNIFTGFSCLEVEVAESFNNNVTIVSASGNDAENLENKRPANSNFVIPAGAVSPVENPVLEPYFLTEQPYSYFKANLPLISPYENNDSVYPKINLTSSYYSRNKKGSNFSKDKNVVWAPGTLISLAYSSISNGDYGLNKPQRFDGTSASAPFIGGTISLMLSVNPSLTPQQIKDILFETSRDYGKQVKSHPNMLANGYQLYDPKVKLIDVYEAVKKAKSLAPLSKGNRDNSFSTQALDTTFDDSNILGGSNPIKVSKGSLVGVALNGNTENLTITIDDKEVSVLAFVKGLAIFGIPDGLSQGVKDVIIKTAGGNLTFENAVDILSSQNNNNKIIFNIEQDGSSQIYSMNIDGSDKKQLTFDSSNYVSSYSNTDYISPDGKEILFISTRDGSSEIYKMNIDGTNQVKLTNQNNTGLLYLEPSWSPDGSKIAFGIWETYNSTYKYNLFAMNSDGNNLTNLTNSVGKFNTHHSWSPDSSKIAFITNMFNSISRLDLAVYNFNTSNIIRLTSGDYSTESPTWSPDGSKIAFSSNKDSNISIENGLGIGIFTINSDGSNITRLSFETWRKYHSNPRWIYNGDKLVFCNDNYESYSSDPYNIFQVDFNGNNLTNLSNNDNSIHGNNSFAVSQIIISKDNKKILYSAYKNSFIQLFILDTDIKQQIQITNDEFNNTAPNWTIKNIKSLSLLEELRLKYKLKPLGSN